MKNKNGKKKNRKVARRMAMHTLASAATVLYAPVVMANGWRPAGAAVVAAGAGADMLKRRCGKLEDVKVALSPRVFVPSALRYCASSCAGGGGSMCLCDSAENLLAATCFISFVRFRRRTRQHTSDLARDF